MHLTIASKNTLSAYLQETHSLSKFRPIFEIPLYYLIKIFDKNPQPYLLINSILIVLSTYVVYILLYKEITKNKYISILSGIALITSRFGSYHQLQILGIMENMCILFLVLIIYFNLKTIRNKYITWYDLASLFFSLLIIFTHERFILAIVPLVTIYLYKFKKTNNIKFLLFSIFPILFIFLNIIIKQIIGVNFLTAGETRPFQLNTNIIKFILSSALNILGLNIGPDYLSSQSYVNSPILINMLPILNLFCFIKIFKISKIKKINFFYTLVVLIFLLLSASISFRQEFRFLQAPYLVWLIFIGIIYSQNKTRKSTIYIIVLLVSQIIISQYYRIKIENIYFMSGINSVNQTEKIIKMYNNNSNKENILLLVTNSNDEKWYFSDDNFFKTYFPNKFTKIIYLTTEEQKKYIPDKQKIQHLEIDYSSRKLTYKIY